MNEAARRTEPMHQTRAVLREPNFLLYLASRFCTGAAFTLMRATIAWHIFELTGSAFQLGLVGLAQFVPTLLLTLPGGAVADTYDRRHVIQSTQAIAMLAAAAL